MADSCRGTPVIAQGPPAQATGCQHIDPVGFEGSWVRLHYGRDSSAHFTFDNSVTASASSAFAPLVSWHRVALSGSCGAVGRGIIEQLRLAPWTHSLQATACWW